MDMRGALWYCQGPVAIDSEAAWVYSASRELRESSQDWIYPGVQPACMHIGSKNLIHCNYDQANVGIPLQDSVWVLSCLRQAWI